MSILNIARVTKKISVNEIRYFFENYYKRIGFSKEKLLFNETLEKKYLSLLANKLKEKITDLRNAKEYYQSFIR